jgi:hypothetical protein
MHGTVATILEPGCDMNGELDYGPRHAIRKPNTKDLGEMRINEIIFLDMNSIFK